MAALPYDQMFDLSDVILVGKITNISDLLWNQDSGEFWLDITSNEPPPVAPIQFRYVEVTVDRYLLDKVESRKQQTIQLVVYGDEQTYQEGSSPKDAVEFPLAIGDTVLGFMKQTEIAWVEGGRRSVLTFANAPELAYFRQEEDGSFSGTILKNLDAGEFTMEKSKLSLEQVASDIHNHPELNKFEVNQ